MRSLSIAAVAAATLVLQGCAGTEPKGPGPADARYPMSQSERDPGSRVYLAPDLDTRKYTGGFYVDEVGIYRGADADFGSATDADKQELAAFMKSEFTRALGRRVAAAPGPGVVRVHLTLVGTETSRSVGSVLRFTPIGFAVTLAQQAAGLPGTFVGSVTFAGDVTEADTGTVLAAFLTRQSPPAIDLSSGMGELRAAKLGITQGADAFAAAVERLSAR